MYKTSLVLFSGSILYKFYGKYYIQGIIEYIKKNNKPFSNKEDCWTIVKNELDELQVELHKDVKNMKIIPIIMECGDVVHSLLKYIIIEYLPPQLVTNQIIWLIVFYLSLPTSIKLAIRYQKNRCIRNHNNRNTLNHYCNYKKKIY